VDHGTSRYNLAYITDSNYLLATKVSIRSAVAGADGKNITVWLIGVDLSEDETEEVRALSDQNTDIRVISAKSEYKNIGAGHDYISDTALMKFRLPELLSDLEYVLFVDGDTLLFPGFLSVFDTDISDVCLAAVIDANVELNDNRLEMFGHKHYFNSGVLYLNIKKMLDFRSTEKMLEAYLKDPEMKKYVDQDAFNAALGEYFISLPPAYNMLSVYRKHFSVEELHKVWSDYSEDEISQMIARPYLLHFAGDKPWDTVTHYESKNWAGYMTGSEYIRQSKTKFIEDVDRYVNLQNEYEDVKNKYSLTESELGSIQIELDAAKSELGSAKNELGSAKNELGVAKSELGSIKDELAATKTELAAAQSELDLSNYKIHRLLLGYYKCVLGCDYFFADKDTDERILIEGVHQIEKWGRWTKGNETIIYLNTDKPAKNLILDLEYRVFNPEQHVKVLVNDHVIDEYVETTGESRRQFMIPGKINITGALTIRFFLPDAASPKSIGMSEDSRVLSLGLIRMKIDVRNRF